MRRKRLALMALLVAWIAVSAIACSSETPEDSGESVPKETATTLQSSEHDAGEVALCDLTDDLVG